MKSLKLSFFNLFLAFFIILGAALRFWNLGAIPASLDWDENSIGYNAYSILQTGKDEYGKTFPFSFKAFGEYKQPVYIYSAVLPIRIFGLNPSAVRFPSALFGTLSIILIYLLVTELFRKDPNGKSLAVITAGFFAISPWSIQFSRIAFETNLALFFIILGSFLYLKGLSVKKDYLLILSILSFAISLYTYISEKLFVPFILVFLFVYSYKKLPVKKIILLVLLFLALNVPWIIGSEAITRGKGVLLTYNSPEILNKTFEMRKNSTTLTPISRVISAPKVLFVEKIAQNYLSHFDYSFLFFKGDNPRHHAPGMGVLYLFEAPLILLGVFYLLKRRVWQSFFLFTWFFAAPLASALAVDAPSASRAEAMLPIWEIFSAAGLLQIYLFLKKKNRVALRLFYLTFFTIALLSTAFFINQYFSKTNLMVQKDWQYGYKEAAIFAKEKASSSNNVIFDSSFEQPYIFYLFNSKYSPQKYIQTGGSLRIENKCFSMDGVYFGSCLEKAKSGDYYIATSPLNFSNMSKVGETDYVNKTPAVIMYKVQ